jgi:hypothetical protein
MSFSSSMEAKQFLISRIAEEARRQRIPLSELEQKMLFFSESYPTLPDMAEVAQKFESEYNDEEYEKKIAQLSKSAYQRERNESPETAQLWKDAIEVLKKEDHYILVMIDQPRASGDWWKLILTAFLVVVVGAFVLFGFYRIADYRVSDNTKLLVLGLLVMLTAFLSLDDKAGKAVSNVLERVIERLADHAEMELGFEAGAGL